MRASLEDAIAHVPFYRSRSASYAIEHAESLAAFARVPLLTKPALRAALPFEILSDRANGANLDTLRTSGTGGERLTVMVDPAHVGIPAEDLALWGLPRDPRLKRVAVLASPECLGRSCDGTYESRLDPSGRQLILPSTDEPLLLERPVAETIVAELARFDAGELFANPVYLHALVRACRRDHIALPDLALILLSYQHTTRCQRRAIADAFPRARIASLYGASELGGATVGIECLHGRMHAWFDQAFVEILDDNGARVPDGARGQLAITTLGIWVMPLIRYLIGDLGILRDEPCTCPLGAFPTLEHHGRAQDALHVAGRVFSTRDIDDAIGAPDGLDVWQVVQRGETLELRCVPALDTRLDLEAVAELVARATGARVTPRIVDAIDPELSGKIAHTRRSA